MADDPTPKELPAEAADSLPATTWETALDRAGAAAEPAAPPAPDAPRRSWQPWVRAAAPLLIVFVYLGWKAWSGREVRDPELSNVETVGSLSGVRPAETDVRIDKATQEFVGRLEAMRTTGNWAAVGQAIAEAPEPIASHPTVRAFGAVSTVFGGGRVPPELLRTLRTALSRDAKQRPLVDCLKLAEAEVWFRASTSTDTMLRNMDKLRELVATQESVTREVLDFRIKLAERFERLADYENEAAGKISPDRANLATARNFYQQGLRWVTTPDGWTDARPVAEGKASLVVDHILDKLRVANRRYNGPSLPWSDRDSETWTGKKGDPVHDNPGGRW